MKSKPIETTLDENENEAEDFDNKTLNIALLEKFNDNQLKEMEDGAKITKESEYAHVHMWEQRWAYSSIIDCKRKFQQG